MSDPDIDHVSAGLDEKPEPALKPLDRDEKGNLILSAEELANRGDTFRRLMAEWATWPDEDPPGASEQFLRNIDEERRTSGMRTLFEDYY